MRRPPASEAAIRFARAGSQCYLSKNLALLRGAEIYAWKRRFDDTIALPDGRELSAAFFLRGHRSEPDDQIGGQVLRLDLLLRSRDFYLLFPQWEQCYKGRMRVIARNVLLAYARVHPETSVPLERWYRLVKAANWTSMDDIRHAAPTSKVLNRDRVRFEVAGGNYRLIAAFDFRRQIVFVKFVGSHAEYDAIDALTVAKF